MRLDEAINSLIDTYKSIDIRTASFLSNGAWHSTLMIIRLRKEDPDYIKNLQEERIKKYGSIQAENFRVDLYALPITRWNEFYTNWCKNFVCFEPSFAVNIPNGGEFNYQFYEPYSHEDLNFVDSKWKSYNTSSRISGPGNNYEIQKHDGEARKNHSRNVMEYFQSVFEIPDIQVNSHTVAITAPVFFKIDKLIFGNNSITVNCSGYVQGKIDIVIDFSKFSTRGNQLIPVDKIVISKNIPENSDIPYSFSEHRKLDSLNPNHIFRVDVYRDGAILESFCDSIGAYWPDKSQVTNPFFNFFEKFVPYEDLTKMLFNFESEDIKAPALVFERAISWLLNLVGIRAIWLGKTYETIGKDHNRISVDVLASNNSNVILLVNSTIAVPKESDFDSIRNYRDKIMEVLNIDELQITSVLFSGKSVKGSDNLAKNNDVIIIGKDEIIRILELLRNGDIVRAQELLTKRA